MIPLRLAAAALNQTPLDWEGNLARILAAIEAARQAEASVLCLPELCISGYGCEDQFFSAGVHQTSLDMLAEVLPYTKGITVALGLPLVVGRGLFNGAALVCNRELLGVVLKQHLAGDGLHYEPRWFRRWPAGQVKRVDLGGRQAPVGDLLFDCGGVRIGIEICRDAWVANRPGSYLAEAGADIILNPTASHFAFHKQDIRRRIVLEGSRTFDASYVFANVLGNEAGRAIFDGGTLIASGGRLLAEGPRLSFADHVLTCADIDVGATRRLRLSGSEPSRRMGEFCGEIVSCDVAFPAPKCPCPVALPAAWEMPTPSKEEEFARSIALALFDYLRKSGSDGFVISLSGGADSSAVAAMVWLMVKLAVEELGLEAFLAKLGHIDHVQPAKSENAIVGQLLACAYQSTRNSGDVTRTAAASLAEAVGAQFYEWSVDPVVDYSIETISRAIGRELTWDRDDTTLQNIQARARGPMAWMLANLRNAILLVTSNRSEAAVGYATMDGDTCGGLAPIAGIDKAYLLEWLKWMERDGPVGVGPLPILGLVNRQRPTAELRPASENQTDEADLMPYPVLDAIQRAAVRDKLTPREAFQKVRPKFPDFSARELGGWVEKFYSLWRQSQWKRERFAPSFHVDDSNLDPKSWCRFPILTGSQEADFEELRAFVSKEK